MIAGAVIGIVEENQDPEGLHRIKIRLPVDSEIRSAWCRMVSPMAGQSRGLVMLPEVGSEVLVMHSYRSHQPVVMGALYNGGEDPPEPYHNDDGKNNRRVLWTRNGNMVDFDDTPGAEKVSWGSGATTRLEVTSAPVHHVFNAAEKTIQEHAEGSIFYRALGRISIKCRSFKLKAEMVQLQAQGNAILSGEDITLECGGTIRISSPDTQGKTATSAPQGQSADSSARAKHLPKVA